jgi:hypothetical protein
VYIRWLERDNAFTRLLARRAATVRRVTFATTLIAYPAFCALSWLGVAGRRALGKKPRVVWGPTPILTIGESSTLLRRLGYPSTTVVFTTYHIRSEFDVNFRRAIANPAVGPWLPNLLHLWSLLRFDVFHFFYDGGLWSGMNVVPSARWLELPLLRLAGKRVIASAYGADVRVRHLNQMWQPYNICEECPAPGVYCVCGPEGLTRAKYYRDWANVLLAMGDMSDFVTESRRDFNYWPIDVEQIPLRENARDGGPVRVVHSPNHPYFKGTRFLEEAVAALRERGHDLELDLVQGVPNEEAKRRYGEADIVFAQCLAGWLGYTELEAMAAGKPVIGYIRNAAYVEHTGEPPLVSATPATLEQELEGLVTDRARREELGRLGRDYVERAWSYEALSPAYDRLHTDVWERNELGRTLARKWSEAASGESGYRVARTLRGAELRETAVYPDPRLEMDRFVRGFHGQPPFDGEGIPRVYRSGAYVEDAAVVARYALAAFHLGLSEPEVAHEEQFAVAARWLRDRPDVNDSSALSEGLRLSVLLRADAREPDNGFAEAARATAERFRAPMSAGGLLVEENDLTRLAPDPQNSPVARLTESIAGMLALHEYARVSGERWPLELFERCAASLRRTLADAYAHVVRADPRADQDLRYLLVHQLRALHELTRHREFNRRADRWARQLYAKRVTDFLRLRAPI